VAALACALGAFAPPAGAQNACEVVRHSYPPGHHRHRPPLVVGDSGYLLAAPALARLGIEADARGCRQIGAANAILAARRHAHTLPRIVVLGVGANGGVNAASLRQALAIVGRRRILGLVTTPASPSSAYAMRRLAARTPRRVVLIDWAASGIPQRYGGDGIHIGPAAEAVLARFIWRRVRPYVPPRSLVLPRSTANEKACGTVHRRGRALAVYVVRGEKRIVCKRARAVVRARSPERVDGWHWFDWRVVGRRPWTDVYVRPSGKVVVAATPA
jgi:hypothetical protein